MNRRDFLRASSIALGSAVVSTGLQGCIAAEASTSPRGTTHNALQPKITFQHGVASGDPLQDRVIIWTRLTPLDESNEDASVGWEVATDPEFRKLLHKGSTVTGPARDYTVKVDVLNLQPATRYYYRFVSDGLISPSGVTRTLPQGDIKQVRFAVLSCANFPAGYFHAYSEAARVEQLDAVLHLGDYIYEYGSGQYATGGAQASGRALPPDNDVETLTLSDYRKRYALYRTDQDLQMLHAAAPFIAVWDDHEISNDTWQHGAQNHADEDGDFQARKDAALQAWFEWIPARPASPDDQLTIYRRFDFGKLVSLHMLDTRVVGRDRQLTFGDYYDDDGFKPETFRQDSMDSSRGLLGPHQRDWLYRALETSDSTWQVLGQQVVMGRRMLPHDLLSALQDYSATAEDLANTLQALQDIKRRQQSSDTTLTSQEIERVETLVPFSLDAWDGYAHEREALLTHAIKRDSNLVMLTGDSHNAWASELMTNDGKRAGVEFVTSSVTSPGMEEYLNIRPELITLTEQAITTLADDIQYVNLFQRGYMLVTFTPEQATAEWHFVNNVKQRECQMDQTRHFALTTGTGAGNRRLFPVI